MDWGDYVELMKRAAARVVILVDDDNPMSSDLSKMYIDELIMLLLQEDEMAEAARLECGEGGAKEVRSSVKAVRRLVSGMGLVTPSRIQYGGSLKN